MSTNTLTSLAILKVAVDKGSDYLDYLRPFVLHVLSDSDSTTFTPAMVRTHIQNVFGLEVPTRTVAIVLRRLSRRHPIRRDHGAYQKTGKLPDTGLLGRRAHAERHIESIVHALRRFADGTPNALPTDDAAIAAICAFLAKFDITCLRAYLRQTAIPRLQGAHRSSIVLVSDFVERIQKTDPERFGSFVVLVQGHMLANALLCPDLQNAPNTYRRVAFYLDTPLIIRRLGLEGDATQSAVRELIALVGELGGKIAVYTHTCDEVNRVLRNAADYLDRPDGQGSVIFEARRRGTTKSDLILVAESIDDRLRARGISVVATPPYAQESQIDEAAFERVLDTRINYRNPNAKTYDINSVRSTYVLRGRGSARSVEKARAVFVTSNSALADAAWEYGQQHESSHDVSSVITDFALANIAWLKSPMKPSSVPTTQLLAFSYAALQPSDDLWTEYLREIDRLEQEGTISVRDHQLLRSSPHVGRTLVGLTRGDPEAIAPGSVKDTLAVVTEEMNREGTARLDAEKAAHRATRKALDAGQDTLRDIVSNLRWQCRRWARWLANSCAVGLTIILVIGLLAGIGFGGYSQPLSLVVGGSSVVLIVVTLANLMFGSTVRNLHLFIVRRFYQWLVRKRGKWLRVDVALILDDDASDLVPPTDSAAEELGDDGQTG